MKQDDWVQVGIDQDRRALKEFAILFADGDQDERRPWYVNSVQIRNQKLTDAEIMALGGPAAGGIPLLITGPAAEDLAITGVSDSGTTLVLSWQGGKAPYTVQKKTSLTDANWTDVVTTDQTTAIVPKAGAIGFFRVRGSP